MFPTFSPSYHKSFLHLSLPNKLLYPLQHDFAPRKPSKIFINDSILAARILCNGRKVKAFTHIPIYAKPPLGNYTYNTQKSNRLKLIPCGISPQTKN